MGRMAALAHWHCQCHWHCSGSATASGSAAMLHASFSFSSHFLSQRLPAPSSARSHLNNRILDLSEPTIFRSHRVSGAESGLPLNLTAARCSSFAPRFRGRLQLTTRQRPRSLLPCLLLVQRRRLESCSPLGVLLRSPQVAMADAWLAICFIYVLHTLGEPPTLAGELDFHKYDKIRGFQTAVVDEVVKTGSFSDYKRRQLEGGFFFKLPHPADGSRPERPDGKGLVPGSVELSSGDCILLDISNSEWPAAHPVHPDLPCHARFPSSRSQPAHAIHPPAFACPISPTPDSCRCACCCCCGSGCWSWRRCWCCCCSCLGCCPFWALPFFARRH